MKLKKGILTFIAVVSSNGFSQLFNNINHDLLQDFVKQRVNDGGIFRLVGK